MTRAEENRRAEEIAERTVRYLRKKEAATRQVYVVIFGTRHFRDYKLFEREVTKFLKKVMKLAQMEPGAAWQWLPITWQPL